MRSTKEVKDLYKTLKKEFFFSFFGCAGSSLRLVGFSSCGLQSAWAQKLQVEGLVAQACGILVPWWGIQSAFPALEDRFFFKKLIYFN